ncbi:hypothetical protein QEJ31_01080 [Pigmentibacter sp. JX0631]|uniref:hypothetical protein n=1 Tax=Pigmentibacter sp. JX0631 TaxID=2976982 RepID=UPI0024689D05|nr:hypothetical protein [Pigmentibacter sp. JX0631]WGL60196.1 hypothetical protein QEJ31_01080 [Pigmentibacter sp. JX0631]
MLSKWKSELGQSLTEYAIILSLVAVAAVAATAFFGGAIKGKIASLAGVIAGQDVSKVSDAEKKAKNSAEKAQKNAGKVNGNTSITQDDDIFDSESL